ncbi:MAG: UDP-N-acetylmuramate dehydrogenase [Deltaproteobacteria bacterium]|nr:MAG: UDP-N-acetylmuramate dehydrogenase [Deltaproteobacteria bacterium]
MDDIVKQKLSSLCSAIFFDEPMSKYTSIRVGGPADVLIYPKTIEEVQQLVALAKSQRLPITLLGAGSNLLVQDKGIRGLVLNLSQGFNQVRVESETKDLADVYVGAGVGLPRLVDFCAEKGLAGAEVLSGIPGNVGGALIMNAGTKDGDISEVLKSVTFIDKEGRLLTKQKEYFSYKYRESHFPKNSIVLSAVVQLKPLSTEMISGKIQKYKAYRLETQPLNIPSLGSVFQNPEGHKKIFAGKLIEDAGLKNVRVGGARISAKHANWIVNEGGATAKDILVLIGLVKDKVKEKFSVKLETEVKIVGEE